MAADVPAPRAAWTRWTPDAGVFAVVAAVQVGGTLLAARHQDAPRGLDPLGVGLLAAGAASVLLRRRSPAAAVGLAFGATAGYWALGFPRGPIFASLLVTVGGAILAGRRAVAVGALVAGFLVFTWSRSLLGREEAPGLAAVVGLAAWLVAILSVGEVVRTRRERARDAQRSRDEAVRRQATEERLRIARELHDAVAHSMSLINIQAGVALHLMNGGGDGDGGGKDRLAEAKVADALDTIKRASREALVELRSILGVLRAVDEEAPRAPTPSLERIDELVATAALSGVAVRLDVDPGLAEEPLPRPVDLAAYRIIQESLTNVARHSDRPEATVRVRRAEGVLTVEVLDEGSGRAAVAGLPSGGNGIPGMGERAASVGGELTAGPRPGRGFAVRARLPLGGDG